MHRRVAVLLTLLLFLGSSAWAGLGSNKTMYMGGTVPNLKEKTQGKSSMTEGEFVFTHKGGDLRIPFAKVNGLEYGQKAGRRVGMAIALSPFLLFSKKRRHYLTVSYIDADGKQQAAVLELGKAVIQGTLTTLEAKTGKKIEYQDEEARKTATGSK